MSKFAGDLHTHSLASGHAYSTITEMAVAAAEKGLTYLGLCEHGPNMPGAPHYYYFGNLRVVPPQIAGVNILAGVEANIINCDGELDLPTRILARLPWVLAGFHSDAGYSGGSLEENTQAAIKVLANPLVDGLVHPGNPTYPLDYEQVVSVAAELGKAIEINNASLTVVRQGSLENCTLIARLAAKLRAPVLISSDAHFADDIGKLDAALALARKCGISDDQIINLTAEGIEAYLAKRGKLKRQDSASPQV